MSKLIWPKVRRLAKQSNGPLKPRDHSSVMSLQGKFGHCALGGGDDPDTVVCDAEGT
jgi:hypothetical protein